MIITVLCSILYTQNSYANREYEIKAAFILKLIPFVEWPTSNIEKKGLILGIVGNNPFSQETLFDLERDKIHGKKIQVLEILDDLSLIQKCDLVFINSEPSTNTEQILSFLKDLPVLTISDGDGLAQKGIMINFILVDNKIRFEINKQSLDKSAIKASYKLLMLANKVY